MFITAILILFLMLEVLIIFEFQTIGMIPVDLVFACVGLPILIMLIKKRKTLQANRISNSSNIFLFIYFFFIISERIPTIVCVFVPLYDRLYQFWIDAEPISVLILIGIHFLGLYIFWRDKQIEKPLNKWIIFSIIIGLFKLLIRYKLGHFPLWVYRYYGIFDFAAIFCWLIAIDSFLKLKCENENAELTGSALYQPLLHERVTW